MRAYLLAAPGALLLAAVLVGPLVGMARMSVYEPPRGRGFYAPGTWTLENYAALQWHPVGATLAFGVAVAVLVLGLALPLAFFVRGRGGAGVLVLLPKLAGAYACTFALQQLLPRGFASAALAEAYLVLPYAVLILVAQLARIDPAYALAARGLGASPRRAFFRVTLPLMRPSLVLAGQLAFAWGLGAFLGPLLLAGPDETTLAVELHRQAFEYGHWPRAAANGVVLALLTASAFAFRRRELA